MEKKLVLIAKKTGASELFLSCSDTSAFFVVYTTFMQQLFSASLH